MDDKILLTLCGHSQRFTSYRSSERLWDLGSIIRLTDLTFGFIDEFGISFKLLTDLIYEFWDLP